jgi:hypothetical protein
MGGHAGDWGSCGVFFRGAEIIVEKFTTRLLN